MSTMKMNTPNRDVSKATTARAKKGEGKPIIKSGDPIPYQKLNNTIPLSLHKQFKIECMKQDKEMGGVLQMLIENWLKSEGVALDPYI